MIIGWLILAFSAIVGTAGVLGFLRWLWERYTTDLRFNRLMARQRRADRKYLRIDNRSIAQPRRYV